jgi:hypothetical protein
MGLAAGYRSAAGTGEDLGVTGVLIETEELTVGGFSAKAL